MKKIAFIVNPISGSVNKENTLAYIKEVFQNRKDFVASAYVTTGPGDAFRTARNFADQKYDTVVAVGGDGTVNEVARGLLHSDTVLGIVPVGSGNGLARHLHIPLTYTGAVKTLLNGNKVCIDAGKINDEIFFCTAGLGFEAVISNKFNSAPKRGLFTYVEFCAKEFVKYKSEKYDMEIGGNSVIRNAFLITFANSSQWGNNAYISPNADISDGFINVVIWKKAPLLSIPFMAAELFMKTINYSNKIETYKCRSLTIIREREGYVQIDGESRSMGKIINVKVLHNVLNVIVPK